MILNSVDYGRCTSCNEMGDLFACNCPLCNGIDRMCNACVHQLWDTLTERHAPKPKSISITHDSSHLFSSLYDYDTCLLTITFRKPDGTAGASYAYADVPKDVFDSFSLADSPGTFFHKHIKPAYKATKAA